MNDSENSEQGGLEYVWVVARLTLEVIYVLKNGTVLDANVG